MHFESFLFFVECINTLQMKNTLKYFSFSDTNKSNDNAKLDTHNVVLMKQDSGTSENMVISLFFLKNKF